MLKNTPMAERKFGHTSRNGTKFKAERCDFKTGVRVIKPAGISEARYCQDVCEFGAFHAMNIRDELHSGFGGYDTIDFTVETRKDE